MAGTHTISGKEEARGQEATWGQSTPGPKDFIQLQRIRVVNVETEVWEDSRCFGS